MDVKELRDKRSLLAADIAGSVSRLVEDFKMNTDFCPHSIYINMIEITTCGDNEPQFVVGGCNVKIEI